MGRDVRAAAVGAAFAVWASGRAGFASFGSGRSVDRRGSGGGGACSGSGCAFLRGIVRLVRAVVREGEAESLILAQNERWRRA